MVPVIATGDGANHEGTRTAKNRPSSPLPSSSPPSSTKKDLSGDRQGNHQNEMVLSLREELCKLVAGLSVDVLKDSTLEANVAETLDPFFASVVSSFDDRNDETQDSCEDSLLSGITPLVIACDRGNLACLQYFCRLLEREVRKPSSPGGFWEALIGNPLKSRTVPDGTTALHHCTTELAIRAEQQERCSGEESFLELLERIFIAQESLRCSDGSSNNNHKKNIILELGEAVNSHGDTPLMMAVANNIVLEDSRTSSAKAFVQRWYKTALERCHSERLQLQKDQIKCILTAKNDLGRTVLSYAWAEGIVDLIQWLMEIDDGRFSSPIITSEETLGFRKSMGVLSKKIQSNSNNSTDTTNAYQKNHLATEECTRLLEAHVENRSEQMAKLLLEELEGKHSGHSKQKPPKKKKKKKKKQQQQQEQEQKVGSQHPNESASEVDGSPRPSNGEWFDVRDSLEDKSHKELSSGDKEIGSNASDSKTGDLLRLTKLNNGRLAVKVPGQQPHEESPREDNPSLLPSAWYRKRTFSLDETNQLLRDRYKQGSTNASSSALPINHGTEDPVEALLKTPNQSSDADSVLSALCLDVNCLLYSDYGMALNLSPAQLDAVEQILREQLQSVAKARLLQERRCKGKTDSSSLVSAVPEG